jgi:hypothetical protein
MAPAWGNTVGRVGLEPTTYGLKVRYSAIELAPLAAKRSQLDGPVGNGLRSASVGRVGGGSCAADGGLGGERELDRAYLRAIILPRPPPVPYALRVPNGQTSGGIRTSREGSAPSSSGLGHRPFKAAARVRIPLGLPPETVGNGRSGQPRAC